MNLHLSPIKRVSFIVGKIANHSELISASRIALVLLLFFIFQNVMVSSAQSLSITPTYPLRDKVAVQGVAADGWLAATTTYSYTTFLPIVARQWDGLLRTYLPLIARDYPPTASLFSLQMYGDLNDNYGLNKAIASGARWIRFPLNWASIEPVNTTPANYNWSSLDSSLSGAAAANMLALVTIDSNPAWAAADRSGAVNDLNDLTQFVGAAVARYPQIKYWELYNEPDNDIGAWGGKAVQYAAMMNAVYPVIKLANPAAQVVMGGIALDWFDTDPLYTGTFDGVFLDTFLNACAQPCFDIANFHYYAVFRGRWAAYGRDLIGKAEYLRLRLNHYGFGSRPVMNTETGWAYLDSDPDSDWGSPTVQARYVPKSFVRGSAARLLLVNWYMWTDGQDPSQPGLLSNDLAERPAYFALQTVISELRDATFVRALKVQEIGNQNLEGYMFSTPSSSSSQRIDVIWYDCPTLVVFTPDLPVDCNTTATYRIHAAQVGVRQYMPGPMLIKHDADDGVTDGMVSLQINADPIYIHYLP
jgi:hypothetical protein